MPFNITNPITQNITPSSIKVTFFGVDNQAGKLYVTYELLDSTSSVLGSSSVTIEGAAFIQAVADANTALANMAPTIDCYAALKQSIYKQLVNYTGLTGTVV